MKDLLSTRLVVWIGVPMTILFVATIWLASERSASKVLAQTEEIAREKARRYAEEIDNQLARVARIPLMHARVFESGTFTDEAKIDAYLQEVVRNNRDVYGSCLAFEPEAFVPGQQYYAPYAYWKPDGEFAFSQIGNPEYNHFKWPWYQLPKAAGHLIWTEPYFDDGGGNILMTTCSVPFYKDGKFFGVATIDVALAHLTKETERFKMGVGGYAFIVSQQGRFLAYPDPAKIMNGSLQEMNSELANKMMGGTRGFIHTRDPLRGRDAWVAFEPVPSSGFSLAMVYPADEVMAEAYKLRSELIGLGVLGVVVLVVALLLLARSISRPVAALAEAAREVAGGNFETKIDAHGATDEVRGLAQAFNKMTRDLQMRMHELRYTTTIKERLEGELAGARSIQISLLPKEFPKAEDFELHAIVKPAREVGGDFYDFFRLADGRLAILIGDVSGKGIPAALFMAVTKTLIKASSLPGRSLGEIMFAVNNELCNEADSGMFVTLLYALLDTDTGDLEFCNAGHPSPYLLRADGQVVPLDAPPGVAFGLMHGVEFRSIRVRMATNESLFMFTDGVTEALDKNRVFYTTRRLQVVLRDVHELSADRVTRAVVRDVRAFSGEAEQSDDISVLALRWLGVPSSAVEDSSSHLREPVSLN